MREHVFDGAIEVVTRGVFCRPLKGYPRQSVVGKKTEQKTTFDRLPPRTNHRLTSAFCLPPLPTPKIRP